MSGVDPDHLSLVACLGLGLCCQPLLSAEPAPGIFLGAGEAVLYAVEQRGVDLRVEIADGDAVRLVDHPLGATGPELFLLGPYPEGRTVQVSAVAKHPSQEALEAAVRRVGGIPTEAVESLALFTRAGVLAAGRSEEELRGARAIYAQLGSGGALKTLVPGYALLPAYLEASLSYRLFDIPAVLAALDSLEGCAVPGYCYKQDLLRLLALGLNDDYAPLLAPDGLAQLIEELRGRGRETSPDLVAALTSMAVAMIFEGSREDAEGVLDEALERALAGGDPALLGSVHNILATYHFFQQERIPALDHLLSAVEQYSLAQDDRGAVYAMVNLHQTYGSLGEYGDAQQILHRALATAEASPDKSLAKEVYVNLARLYHLMGDLERAEYYSRLALELDLSIERSEGRLNETRRLLGTILRERGELVEAAEIHSRALEENSSTGDSRHRALLLEQLALDHLALGDPGLARDYLQRAYTETDYGRTLQAQPDARKLQARLLMAEGRHAEAAALLEPAASEAAGLSLASRVEAHQLLMQAHAALGDHAEAIRQGRSAVALIQDIRIQLESSRLGPAWSSRTNVIHKQLAELLLNRYYAGEGDVYLEQAFLLVEQSRSFNLLRQRGSVPARAAGSEGEEARLLAELAAASAGRAALASKDEEQRGATLAYYRALERYQSHIGAGGEQPPPPEVALSDLAGRLGSEEILFEYLCVPGSDCHLITLQDGGLEAFRLASYEDIALSVNAVNAELSMRGSGSRPGISRLSAQVLTPFLPSGKRSLMVVLDYPLNRIPMAVLSARETGAPYRPVIEDYAVSYLPALQAFRGEREKAASHSVELAVLADPVFSASALPAELAAMDTFRGWVEKLEPLPWSAVEARNLSTIFVDRSVRVFTGQEANRHNLFDEETRNARILHLASHAFFNESMADLVGIAISSPSNSPEQEGDFVTLNELQSVRFNAELVVISGCETGRGEYYEGEGSMSLARGFLTQGADNVISTLWPVSDRASAQFMKLFYEALHLEKLAIPAALQSAQQRLAADPLYRDPFYWAAYVLTSVAD